MNFLSEEIRIFMREIEGLNAGRAILWKSVELRGKQGRNQGQQKNKPASLAYFRVYRSF
jgi:hypothetical protein